MAEVSPVYKKGDVMDNKNYGPISVVPNLSKVFEKVMVLQLTMYFNDRFSPHVSGYRKYVLLKLVDTCKVALDKNQVYDAVLADLSKAFVVYHID